MHNNLSSYVYGCLKRMYGDIHCLIYWHNRQYGGLCVVKLGYFIAKLCIVRYISFA